MSREAAAPAIITSMSMPATAIGKARRMSGRNICRQYSPALQTFRIRRGPANAFSVPCSRSVVTNMRFLLRQYRISPQNTTEYAERDSRFRRCSDFELSVYIHPHRPANFKNVLPKRTDLSYYRQNIFLVYSLRARYNYAIYKSLSPACTQDKTAYATDNKDTAH